MKNSSSSLKTRRVALSAILCGAALTIFTIEAQIPTLLPIPGIKLGLANIVTLFALLYLSAREAFLILIGRILLGSLFAASPSVLIYSLAGGILSLIGEVILIKLLGKKFIAEISVVGAMLHNTAQIICAAFITGSTAVFYYLPPLLIAAAITGAFCGLCVLGIDKRFGSVIIKLLQKQKIK